MASNHTTVLKLPQFWLRRDELGSTQVEAQFNVHKITSGLTKYSYTAAALEEDMATRVLDILIQPTATHKYTTLKVRLVDTFWQSEWEAAAKILQEDLSDSNLLELIDKMLALVPPGESPSFLFREVFLRKLPPQVQALITQTEIKDLWQLAKAPDKHFFIQWCYGQCHRVGLETW
uniref:DUF7041 domain-containing protein n=1 Tax=Octopus bimaculoides TaxID=37653 RepID=A0A0L8GN52_OCTBM